MRSCSIADVAKTVDHAVLKPGYTFEARMQGRRSREARVDVRSPRRGPHLREVSRLSDEAGGRLREDLVRSSASCRPGLGDLRSLVQTRASGPDVRR